MRKSLPCCPLKTSVFLYWLGHKHAGVTCVAERKTLTGTPPRHPAGRPRDTR